jgi:membrane-bound serine protease (ClpP class)
MTARHVGVLTTVLAVAAAMLTAGVAGGQSGTEAKVPSIEVSGDLNPAEADWVGHALGNAVDADAPFAIIRLDTPGGLESSAEEIVDSIRTAPIPIVVYVSPGGASALADGASIVDASDVAAMAPGTTLEVGGNEEGENTAQKRGRIQFIASDQEKLLQELNGYEVRGPKATTLETAQVEIDDEGMTLPYQVLDVLVNPNVAFLLLLIGLLGIALELFAPGTIIPGAVGVVALVLGIFGAVQLPVAALGVILLVAGIGLIIAESHLPTAGVLGVIGVVALAAGGLMIFDTDSDSFEVSTALVITVAGILGLATVFVGGKAVEARHRPVASGPEHLIGEIAIVRTDLDPVGQVYVEGALWRARVDPASEPIGTGYRVSVDELDGLTLVVSPAGEEPAEIPTEGAG